MSAGALVVTNTDGAVRVVTMNRPEARNALVARVAARARGRVAQRG